jgi:predicted O-methyltransferase YrrM
MYSPLQSAFKYFQYYFTASGGKGYGIHSPFVFDFITKVINDKTEHPDYRIVENLRKRMLDNPTMLTIEDFGAGSSVSETDKRTVASIAKNAAKPKKYGQLLYRIIKKYQPRTILELGTSLGITTSYFSLANSLSEVITLEGASSVADIAKKNFNDLQLKNIELIEGNFDDTLSSAINQLSTVNFVFVDGNHRYEPTLNYFRRILPNTNNDSILVFDDIHWSREMEQAWEQIKTNEAVRCSIDLFFIGIIFFRQEFREKQNFVIRF